jgi:outer membrane protein assembly factor BamD
MIRLVTLLVALALIAGCSGNKPKLSADDYYKQASEAFTKHNYEVAVTHYKELLDQYPFSDHAEEAELRIAHAQYKSKHYPEAIAAFNDFQRMHPMSAHLPEVYYLLGKSYMDQMTTTDRDQGASENAHGWFRVVIDRYPTSPFADKARRKLGDCRRSLADHELYIARYYFKRKNIRAGESRVKGILENYADTPAATHAVEELAEAYARAGEAEHERMARAAVAARQQAAAGKNLEDATAGAHDAASEILLADLTTRYGPSQGVSTAATAPSLIDPVQPKTGLPGVRGSGPGAGSAGNGEPLGGY